MFRIHLKYFVQIKNGLCIFHDKDYLDKDYLQNKENEYVIADYEVHKLQVLARLKHKVNPVISNNQPLFCIGFQLADFSLSDLNISKRFTKPVYFSGAQFSRAHFQEIVFFSRAKFEGKEADFNNSEFYGKTYFSRHFNGKTKFNYVLFEGKEKIYFNVENLSNVSFMNTDITGVKFSDKAR